MASLLPTGYVIKAARIATKHGVRFDPNLGYAGGEFLGDVHACARAIMELDTWIKQQLERYRKRGDYR